MDCCAALIQPLSRQSTVVVDAAKWQHLKRDIGYSGWSKFKWREIPRNVAVVTSQPNHDHY